MTKEEFSRIAMTMRTAYSTQKLFQTEETYEVWYRLLADLDYRTVDMFLIDWIRKEPFAPKISDIVQGCPQVQRYELPKTIRKIDPLCLGEGR